jgi:hypothetical protein
MDETAFWELIDKTRVMSANNGWKQADLLIAELKKLEIAEIKKFSELMNHFIAKSYNSDLWDVAFVIGQGCGDDGFWDFRAWLVGQGKEVYENALHDPETLVDVVSVGQETKVQDIGDAATLAYWDITGDDESLLSGSTFSNIPKSPYDEDKARQKYFKNLAVKCNFVSTQRGKG